MLLLICLVVWKSSGESQTSVTVFSYCICIPLQSWWRGAGRAGPGWGRRWRWWAGTRCGWPGAWPWSAPPTPTPSCSWRSSTARCRPGESTPLNTAIVTRGAAATTLSTPSSTPPRSLSTWRIYRFTLARSCCSPPLCCAVQAVTAYQLRLRTANYSKFYLQSETVYFSTAGR